MALDIEVTPYTVRTLSQLKPGEVFQFPTDKGLPSGTTATFMRTTEGFVALHTGRHDSLKNVDPLTCSVEVVAARKATLLVEM